MAGLPLAQAPQEVRQAADRLTEAPVITQDGVALAFAEQAAGQLRYDIDRKMWFRWDGTCWADGGKHRGFQFARTLARLGAAGGSKSELKEAGKAAFAAGVEKFAQGDERLAVRSDIWDADPFLLGTPGGTVDLVSGQLRAARPQDNITKLTGVAPADVDDCPRWLEFVGFVAKGNADVNRYLQQVCGYCLTGDTREHALWFFYGDGGNGKGTFVETIAWILGAYAVAAAMETFTASRQERHSTELAMLHGARLVRASETEQGKAWAEARIKTLTGGDAITARFMRQPMTSSPR